MYVKQILVEWCIFTVVIHKFIQKVSSFKKYIFHMMKPAETLSFANVNCQIII